MANGQAVKLREIPVESFELQKNRAALARARLARWTALLATFPPVREEIAAWAARMEAAKAAANRGLIVLVKVHENELLNWVMALYIVRYGENEGYWPEQMSDADVRRAKQWEAGKTPDDTKYVLPAPVVEG